MSYIQKNLLPDEKLIYRGHRHWIVFAHPVFWLAVCILFSVAEGFVGRLSWFLFLIAVITGISATINYTASEIGVTNMRVIIKVGLIARTSLESMLQNIAAIEVEQTVMGRFLGYGTIIVRDYSGTNTPFTLINDPFGFRRAVQLESEKRYPPQDKTNT